MLRFHQRHATGIIRSANAEQTAAALKTAGFQTMDSEFR